MTTIAHFIFPVDVKRPSILGGKAYFYSFSHAVALYLVLSLSKWYVPVTPTLCCLQAPPRIMTVDGETLAPHYLRPEQASLPSLMLCSITTIPLSVDYLCLFNYNICSIFFYCVMDTCDETLHSKWSAHCLQVRPYLPLLRSAPTAVSTIAAIRSYGRIYCVETA